MVSVRDGGGVSVGVGAGGTTNVGAGVSESPAPIGNWQADSIKASKIIADRLRFTESVIGYPFRVGFVFVSEYAIKT